MEGPLLVHLPLITVDSRGELSIFNTPARVSHWLEAQDVRDGEFRIFDSAGVEYSLSAATDSSSVVVGHAIGNHWELVRALALTYLEQLPPHRRLEPENLELKTSEDVSRALARYGR